jgi:hypothetical protein
MEHPLSRRNGRRMTKMLVYFQWRVMLLFTMSFPQLLRRFLVLWRKAIFK